MLSNILSKLLPIGSRRRQVFKRLLIKNPDNPSAFGKVLLRSADMNTRKRISTQESDVLRSMQNQFVGKRCFIVGNGPSLNKCDLSLLKDEYTFGVNGIFYKTDEMGFVPTFYVVEDRHVVDDNLSRINSYETKWKFFPSVYKGKIQKAANTCFFCADFGFYNKSHPSFGIARFSRDFSKVAYAGQSVTFLNLQLAYYMGFAEVYLIGMDFSYDIPASAIVEGKSIESTDDDPNHFHPDYFGPGKKWHDPQLDRVALNFHLAKEMFEQDGRAVYNSTEGGQLEIFDRVPYRTLF